MRMWINPEDGDRLDAVEVEVEVRPEVKVEGEPGHGFPHYVHVFHSLREANEFIEPILVRDDWDVKPTMEHRWVLTTEWRMVILE